MGSGRAAWPPLSPSDFLHSTDFLQATHRLGYLTDTRKHPPVGRGLHRSKAAHVADSAGEQSDRRAMLRRPWEKQLDRRRAATALVRPVEDRHHDPIPSVARATPRRDGHSRSRRNETRDVRSPQDTTSARVEKRLPRFERIDAAPNFRLPGCFYIVQRCRWVVRAIHKPRVAGSDSEHCRSTIGRERVRGYCARTLSGLLSRLACPISFPFGPQPPSLDHALARPLLRRPPFC